MDMRQAAEDMLESYKEVVRDAMASGHSGNIDYAVYGRRYDGAVAAAHCEVKGAMTVHELRVMLHRLCRYVRDRSKPWEYLALCADASIAPDEPKWSLTSMRRDRIENPASPVRDAVSVVIVDAEGRVALLAVPYGRDDAGLPVWDDIRYVANPTGLVASAFQEAALA